MQQEQLARGLPDCTELRGPVWQASFETRGAGRIPEAERRSTPWTFSVFVAGGSFSLGSAVYGWLPIKFGLSFWAALSSITAGTVLAQLAADLEALARRLNPGWWRIRHTAR